MKHIKVFEQFLNEGTANQEDIALIRKLESALSANFKDVSYERGGKDSKSYDYSGGYVSVTNSYESQTWTGIDPKKEKILQACGIAAPWVKASYTYYEVIGNATPKIGRGGIGILGNNNLNNYVNFDLTDPKKVNFAKEIKDWIKFSERQPISRDLMERLFTSWTPTKEKYKTINTRDQGIGSHASLHVTKAYDYAYNIKDLNKVFGKTEEETEMIIKSYYMFRRDTLTFDWKQGVMLVGGQYTEVWD
jgi:hypothetical protein